LTNNFLPEDNQNSTFVVPTCGYLQHKGRPSSTLAWPRLAEYFARFKLSLDMTCSLEVLAPTLSRVPLWVHPNETDPISRESTKKKKETVKKGQKKAMKKNVDLTNVNDWNGSSSQKEGVGWSTMVDDSHHATSKLNYKLPNPERLLIWKATQSFLGRSIDIANVAHANVPIRIENDIIPTKRGMKKSTPIGPRLIVDVIVHGGSHVDDESITNEDNLDSRDNKGDISNETEHNASECNTIGSKSASMVLIRMVNKVPLLDSAEAVACGLVHGLASKKRIWNSFGLDVNMNVDSGNPSAIPTFDVRDSDQVNPFFNHGAHNLLDCDDDSEPDDENELDPVGTKRKRRNRRHRLLPASVRLGSILVIVHIHAEPAILPLPTLCKVR
jgi:hypothetical protein